MDSGVSQLIVLWEDIQCVFEGAKFVKDGSLLVPFMKDKNHEQINPKRIAYRPKAILEVTVQGSDQPSPKGPAVYFPEIVSKGEHRSQEVNLQPRPPVMDDTDDDSMASSVDTLATANVAVDSDSQYLIKYSSRLRESRSSIDISNSIHDPYLQAIIAGQQIQATGIKELMYQHFEQNRALQEQVIQMKQQLQELQQQTQQTRVEVLRNREESIAQHKQTLDKLDLLQTHLQALLTQTYELHEYPIPRLFIVLPTSAGLDRVSKLFSDQFRLYFLCECGLHTMRDDSKDPHEVHLAKHEGYDLDRPKEFFEKYGPYLLMMMHMVKYGIIGAGVIVPPLATLKLVDGFGCSRKNVDYLTKNIAPLVENTINFLQDTNNYVAMSSETATDPPGFTRLKALEGSDLRRLESYLKVEDKGRVLGNLFRIVTSEGHVKWVCSDHYPETYRGSAIQKLRDFVKDSHGVFIEETGSIQIDIASNTQARRFNDVLANAWGIQELSITLRWDATMDELRDLCNTITKAGIISLTVNGAYIKRPAADVVNRGRRFDPILQLAFNTLIQSIHLVGFSNFLSRVSKSAVVAAPKLRVFSLEMGVPLDEKTTRLLTGFLEYCPGLTTLHLKARQHYSSMNALQDTLVKNHNFETLKVDFGRLVLVTEFGKGKIRDKTIRIGRLRELSSEDLSFIHQLPFTRLVIESKPERAFGSRLADILHHSATPFELHISHGEDGNGSGNQRREMKLLDIMGAIGPNMAMKLRSLLINYGRFTLRTELLDAVDQEMLMTFKTLDSLTRNDLKFIQQGDFTQLAMEYQLMEDETRLIDILRHQSRLSHLHIRRHNGQGLTIVTTKVNLQDLVRMVTSAKQSSSFKSFSIYRRGVFLSGTISNGMAQEVVMKVMHIGDLTSEDLTFICGEHLARLAIVRTAKEDEDHLKKQLLHMIHHGLKVGHLQIGCKQHFLTILNLVLSTRKAILQQGRSFGIREFELMREGLIPFDMLGECDNEATHVQSSLYFHDDSEKFEMRTWIRLQNRMHVFKEDPVYDIIRQYDWSIVYFDEQHTDNFIFAAILDNVHSTGTSYSARALQLESLCIKVPYHGTTSSVSERLDSIIIRSPRFRDLGLYVTLRHEGDFGVAKSLLGRHGGDLSKLCISGNVVDGWSSIALEFPTRTSFPSLISFELWPDRDINLPQACIPWITAMISAPPQGVRSSSSSSPLPFNDAHVDNQSTSHGFESIGSWTALKKIQLRNIQLQPREWQELVDAMDLSALEHLDLQLSNFSEVEFQLLVDRLSTTTSSIPLKLLNVRNTNLGSRDNFTELQGKIPLVMIIKD
ncbi:hypothetical protein BGX31_008043 [Mortierella sp. GBA43]|nr:hypothetical protein BGX31_008043 [Mortierella sp. GBA43]